MGLLHKIPLLRHLCALTLRRKFIRPIHEGLLVDSTATTPLLACVKKRGGST